MNRMVILILLIFSVNFLRCSYSFTGASVPPHLKTIAIPLFQDRSGSAEPTLREDFTNDLIRKFTDDNTLQVVGKQSADAVLEGTILSLSSSSVSVTKGENVNLIRMKITVKVTYKDLVKKKKIFEKNFSNYEDYKNAGDVTENRAKAITEALDKITEDILYGVVANW